MRIFSSLDTTFNPNASIILTIGNFDGVHVGHQAVLEYVKKKAREQQSQTAVITFRNHPSKVLNPSQPVPMLCTNLHKEQLLEKAGIDFVFSVQFTKAFSLQSADEFLRIIKRTIPIEVLVLGSDATIGKDREGDRLKITNLAKNLDFRVIYLSDFLVDSQRISSTQIRSLIQEGQLSLAKKFLGRTYSIYSEVVRGESKGAKLGFPTANILVENLCLPPYGVYAITLKNRSTSYPGIANLGFAPTVKEKNIPMLEVHLFDTNIDLYGSCAEVFFHTFLRPEKKFDTIQELKEQIFLDVIQAKKIHQHLSCEGLSS